MKKSLSDYALLAEVVSAIAVVVSLVFVGLQVRQGADETAANTNALYIESYQDLVNNINTSTSILADNPEFAEIFVRITAGGEFGDPIEEFRFGIYLFQIFRHGDLAYRQFENNLIDEETTLSALQIVRVNTISKRGRLFWEQFIATLGNQRYVDFVESMPAICPPGWDCDD